MKSTMFDKIDAKEAQVNQRTLGVGRGKEHVEQTCFMQEGALQQLNFMLQIELRGKGVQAAPPR